MNCLCAKTYRMRIGIIDIDAPASMICHSAAAFIEYFICTTATVSVLISGVKIEMMNDVR